MSTWRPINEQCKSKWDGILFPLSQMFYISDVKKKKTDGQQCPHTTQLHTRAWACTYTHTHTHRISNKGPQDPVLLFSRWNRKISGQIDLLNRNSFFFFFWTKNVTKFSTSEENFIKVICGCYLLNKIPKSLELISFKEIRNIKYVSYVTLQLHLSL